MTINTSGIHHVRLTVTDIERSKTFYTELFGAEPAIDMSEHAGDSDALDDPERLYAGCVFSLGGQLLGLRPVAQSGDSFVSTRVGLDHVSFAVSSVDDLHATAARLDDAGIVHGAVIPLEAMGVAILSIQDPDDINLELTAPM